MRLLRLTLRNFGPYFGTQTVDLEVSMDAPVVLIYGENERGKTSLLRAIRWCLYGEVHNQSGLLMDEREFANYDARDSGESYEVSVELEFEDQGIESLLKRWMRVRANAHADFGVEIESGGVDLRPNRGNPVAAKDIPEQISRILHQEISDFFLFDGETLARFEQRLRSADTSATLVRTSIEKVLGLPALQLLSRDLESLAAEASKEVQRVARKTSENQKTLQGIDECNAAISDTQRDLEGLREISRQLAEKKVEAERQLSRVDSIKDAFHKRNATRDAKTDLQRDLTEIKEQIRRKISDSWWAPAIPMLQERIAELDATLISASKSRLEISELQRRRTEYELQISTKKCGSCHQSINAEQVTVAKEQIQQIDTKLSQIPTPDSDLEDLAATRKLLNQFLQDSSIDERLRDLDQDVRKIEMRIDELSNIDRELTEELAGNTLDIAALESEYQRILDFIRESEVQIETKEFELNESRSKLRALQNQLNSHVTGDSHIAEEAALLSALEETLKASLDGFRFSMREKVGEEASDIFRQLTTEPDYSGLTITGKYYLEIIDQNQRIIARRSAGAEQIVAMSLIGALVRCAVRQGPVIMDTPFGRLDTGHRRRILEWAPKIGTQVILLVQSGEFDRARDARFLGSNIGREYQIQREASNRSSIVKVEHV